MSVSLYRITEDSDSCLVLKGRKVGLWLLTLFLLVNASVLLYVGLFVMSRRQLFAVIAGSLLGLFFAVCGVAALVWAIRYRSQIEVDREAAVVRLATGRGPASEISFADIASIEVEVRRRRGRPFTLMIPQGPGAFSRPDLEWLRDRWLRDLGGES